MSEANSKTSSGGGLADGKAQLRVLCVGAGGLKAGLVVPQLAKRGAYVRGMIEKDDERRKVIENGAHETVAGDLNDRAFVDEAVKDMDAVFYISPNAVQDEAGVGKYVVEAARNARVRRIVFSSIFGPIIDIPIHAAKAAVEDAILRSGLEYTILQPAMFYQNLAGLWDGIVKTGDYSEPWSNEAALGRVDYRDVAECAAIALFEDRLLYGAFQLCSVESITRTQSDDDRSRPREGRQTRRARRRPDSEVGRPRRPGSS